MKIDLNCPESDTFHEFLYLIQMQKIHFFTLNTHTHNANIQKNHYIYWFLTNKIENFPFSAIQHLTYLLSWGEYFKCLIIFNMNELEYQILLLKNKQKKKRREPFFAQRTNKHM